VVGPCGARGELGCGIPINRQTTKCWSTQQGLACRQAREPREKNIGVNIVIGILLVIILIYIVIGSSSTHRYNYILPLYILAN